MSPNISKKKPVLLKRKAYFLFLIIFALGYISGFAQSSDNFVDQRDGKQYPIITIGKQHWFAKNLDYKIANSWYYNDSDSLGKIYGRLYTWDAAINACPNGWKLPNDSDFVVLEKSLGGKSNVCFEIKEKGTKHWAKPNTGASNKSGFTALPAGFRSNDGTYKEVSLSTYYWSSDLRENKQPSYFVVNNDCYEFLNDVTILWEFPKTNGFSVRCLKKP